VIYEFQRDLLEVDENTRIGSGGMILPYRTPVRKPVSVRRIISEAQGGPFQYEILEYGKQAIRVNGCPASWMKILATYYFDRHDLVEDDPVICNQDTMTVATRRTLWDGGVQVTNYEQAHDDIAIVISVRHENGFVYEVRNKRLNVIRLKEGGPPLETGKVFATYYKCPLDYTLPMDMDDKKPREQWTNMLSSGEMRVAVKPWHDLASGDVFVFRGVSRQREQIIDVSAEGTDELDEFEIARLDDIMDERGRSYVCGHDFILHDNRFIRWIGSRPNAGEAVNVRYAYRPAYSVFENEPIPNALERKRYPVTLTIRRWSRKDRTEREFREQEPEQVAGESNWRLPVL